MESYKLTHTLLAEHYFSEQQLLCTVQKNLITYNQLLKSAVILLIFISELEDFAFELKQELKNAIYQRADKHIFYNLYERIEAALSNNIQKHSGKRS
jgi:hypothetical protein